MKTQQSNGLQVLFTDFREFCFSVCSRVRKDGRFVAFTETVWLKSCKRQNLRVLFAPHLMFIGTNPKKFLYF
ncbi:MAG: hypothetical protein ACRYGL_15250 [Janthinobacterium lividum]